jgi:hypothetical protein
MCRPTYLYVKTHSITGKKYFGKTVENPVTYRGSGIHWKRHVKVHSQSHVVTEVLGLFTDPLWCTLYALEFSALNNIVASDVWLNLKEENGIDGGWTHINEDREKMLAKNSAAGKKAQRLHPNLCRDNFANVDYKAAGKKAVETIKRRYGEDYYKSFGPTYERTDEIKQKWSAKQTGMKMINNGVQNTFVQKDKLEAYFTQGWVLGNVNAKKSLRP